MEGIKNDKIFFKLAKHANIADLKEIIEKINPPWENGSLKVVRNNEIPHLTKTTAYVIGFGSMFEEERMLETKLDLGREGMNRFPQGGEGR